MVQMLGLLSQSSGWNLHKVQASIRITNLSGICAMKVAIVGSRHYRNYKQFKKKLVPFKDVITHVVSGGAKGTDTMAERWAHENGKRLTVHSARWGKYGKAAGPIRNTKIVRDVQMVIAFLAPSSKGTRDTIQKAQAANLPVHIMHICTPAGSTSGQTRLKSHKKGENDG